MLDVVFVNARVKHSKFSLPKVSQTTKDGKPGGML